MLFLFIIKLFFFLGYYSSNENVPEFSSSGRYYEFKTKRSISRKIRDSSNNKFVFYRNLKVLDCKMIVIENRLDTIYKTLNIDEVTAIHYYTTTSAYKDLNSELRRCNGDNSKLSDFNKAYSDYLSSGLKKIPSKFSGRLYRGTSLSDTILYKYKDSFIHGKIITEWAFTSTSEEVDVVRFQYFTKLPHELPVIFIINAVGSKGSPISRFSAYGKAFKKPNEKSENEVLFVNGSKFKVINYLEKSTIRGHRFIEIEMMEIPD